MLFTVFLLLCCSLNSIQPYPNRRAFNLKEILRLRCSLNPSVEAITTWKGSVYLHLYQSEPANLFDVVGVNIGRCLNDSKNHQIIVTTREIQLYIDVSTGQKLIQWTNPYTGETVPVIHVANDPVQSTIQVDGYSTTGYLTSVNQIMLPIDVNLFYPNPLYSNETLRKYSKEQFYQAGEYFKYFSTLDQITNENLTEVSQMDISWTRMGPILPWMNMSSQYNGSMVFSAQGTRVARLDELDGVLLNEIDTRMPIYKNAPECQLNSSSATSWTYFKRYFTEYLSKTQEFPIPKSKEDIPCVPS